jgi:Ca2+-binding RTX toxin-like protein
VYVTTTDKDGASMTTTEVVTIEAVQMQGGTLVVGGTMGNDNIVIRPTNGSGNVSVTINGVKQGTFKPTSLVVYAQAGNDRVTLASTSVRAGPVSSSPHLGRRLTPPLPRVQTRTYHVTVPAVIHGGDGNDRLTSGVGRAVLIGGNGSDRLLGGSGENILIGGTTDHDRIADLDAILAEWSRDDADYATRVSNLLGLALLDDSTVHDDFAADTMVGGSSLDWFFLESATNATTKDRTDVTREVTTNSNPR